MLPKTEDLIEINTEWLGGCTIYDPITGEELVVREDNSTDVPIATEDEKITHSDSEEISNETLV